MHWKRHNVNVFGAQCAFISYSIQTLYYIYIYVYFARVCIICISRGYMQVERFVYIITIAMDNCSEKKSSFVFLFFGIDFCVIIFWLDCYHFFFFYYFLKIITIWISTRFMPFFLDMKSFLINYFLSFFFSVINKITFVYI